MPAYGKALSPPATEALVDFLHSLRGKDLHPAVDASRKLTDTSELTLPRRISAAQTSTGH